MNDIKYVSESLSEEVLLEQLCEECGELVQQAAKRMRILRGENPTPLSMSANYENLVEEMGDILSCIKVLKEKYGLTDELDKVVSGKMARWRERIGRKYS